MNKLNKKQVEAKKDNTQKDISKSAGEKEVEALAIKKHYTQEETKDFLLKSAIAECDPQKMINDVSELLPYFLDKDNKQNAETKKQTIDKIKEALSIFGLETHYHLAGTVNKEYRPFAIELSNRLIREFDCKNSSEIALTETIAGSYIRILEFSSRLNCCTKVKMISNTENVYYMMLSKELDRAEKHFITALTTLKQIKSPNLEINVKTKAAFISKNQQINAIGQLNENIKPK